MAPTAGKDRNRKRLFSASAATAHFAGCICRNLPRLRAHTLTRPPRSAPGTLLFGAYHALHAADRHRRALTLRRPDPTRRRRGELRPDPRVDDPHRRRPRRRLAQMLEQPLDRVPLGDRGDEREPPLAPRARERHDAMDAPQQLGPIHPVHASPIGRAGRPLAGRVDRRSRAGGAVGTSFAGSAPDECKPRAFVQAARSARSVDGTIRFRNFELGASNPWYRTSGYRGGRSANSSNAWPGS